ncbi:cupin domain-containing protein [Spirosoma sp. KCTC 42546]|uniref:cupin domain-containing protein n=1 Tax=Spirosoma sp. KCTC 42546 TaxID=2520506 RepID=UPI00115B29C0|nr:cupin domain-containing protein [Spirosoma sp. KCTC 42546]QDK81537.1 cupin domain-containing protein [Spirosoma sp. KCTC 42546]
MMRRKFLQTTLAAAPLAATTARSSTIDRPTKGFKVNAGEGRFHGHIQLKGVNSNILDVKVSGKDTNGDLAVFEQTSLSPKRGTPSHVHLNQDEMFHVQDGEYQFLVGQDTFHLKTGDSIFLPRKVPHAWTQVSERGRMTVIFQPAGKMEEFFVTMAALEKEPSKEEIAKIFADHDMQVVGPPLKVD